MADDASPSEADSSPYQPAPTGNPVGCAISPNIIAVRRDRGLNPCGGVGIVVEAGRVVQRVAGAVAGCSGGVAYSLSAYILP